MVHRLDERGRRDIPFSEICPPDALELRKAHPASFAAGERDGFAHKTSAKCRVDFDLEIPA